MGGETYYPVDYENIFYQIFFVYLRAESHNKVATIIFFFARAVSHAAVRTDRLCSIYSKLPPPPLPYNGSLFPQLWRN